MCRYGEVIFTGIFSQLALPTSIHRLTGVIDVKNTMIDYSLNTPEVVLP
ncbi:hypothetical protein CDS77_004404 [Salmonella enterica subsp. enterica]|nr:hypothetical protein [Salmonella enterica subsp. enterica]EDS0622718.1 hypothetical protein [Salmonella enterica]EDV3150489.1 hypothetical protein [Salmonella enterica subsp. enterica serovar Chandans]EEE3047251.1 hypothetical protein [Salmonella enterica subsp. enterica serovar Duisburg]EEJ1463787.1 hypothetical protein [Salmonella enterica subsp. enterica serovar Virginia]EEJ6876125.1 hypothetical protein [Salmonella enterica subsp. houtenae]